MTVALPDAASANPPRPESIEDLFLALESLLLSYALRLLAMSSTFAASLTSQ